MTTLSLLELPEGFGAESILMILAGILVSSAPGLVLGPLFKILGFGKIGIVGGSLAAKIQSLMRIVCSGSLFAIFQSGAMGGYGAAILVGIVKAAGLSTAAIGAVLAALSKWKP